jgi:hypothetical protein
MPTEVAKTSKKARPLWATGILLLTAVATVLILYMATGH